MSLETGFIPLPASQQSRARRTGLALAVITRLLLLAGSEIGISFFPGMVGRRGGSPALRKRISRRLLLHEALFVFPGEAVEELVKNGVEGGPLAAQAAQDLKDTTNEENLRLSGMNGREVAYMLPLLLFILWIGDYPAAVKNGYVGLAVLGVLM